MFTDSSFHVSEALNEYLVLTNNKAGNVQTQVKVILDVLLYLMVFWAVGKEARVFYKLRKMAIAQREEDKAVAKAEHSSGDDGWQIAVERITIWNLITGRENKHLWDHKYSETVYGHLFDVYNLMAYTNLLCFLLVLGCRLAVYYRFTTMIDSFTHQVANDKLCAKLSSQTPTFYGYTISSPQVNLPCKFNSDGCGGICHDWNSECPPSDDYSWNDKFEMCTPPFVSMYLTEENEVLLLTTIT